jgi:hypothetical protein
MFNHYTFFLFRSVKLLNQTRNRAASFYFYSPTKQKTEWICFTYQMRSGAIPFQNLEWSRSILSDSRTKCHQLPLPSSTTISYLTRNTDMCLARYTPTGISSSTWSLPCWIDPNGVQRNGTKSQAPFDLTPWSGAPTDGWLWAPVVLRVYKRRKRTEGTDDEVHRDLTLSPTSLSEPITETQRQWESSTLQRYCSGSPALTGSGAVRPPRANTPRIYFHFTD